MKIDSTTFDSFVKNALVQWRQGYERVQKGAVQLFDMSMNENLTSEYSSIDGFTFARRKTEGDDNFQASPNQGYTKNMTKYRVSLQASITWEMRKYDKYREMKRTLSGLGEASAQRMELDLTHRFTFGTATTYVDMDGVTVNISVGDTLALFTTAHTVTGSSTTFRNRVANNPLFSKGGLEAAETLFTSQMIDHSGNKAVVKADTIVTTDDPNTVNTVREFLTSTAAPEGAHEGIVNVYKGRYSHVILPYLATTNTGAYDSTKAKYWMLAAVAHTDAVVEVSEAPHLVSPSAGGNGEDFDNDDWKFKTSAAYGIEIVDPRWIVLSSGDGTA